MSPSAWFLLAVSSVVLAACSRPSAKSQRGHEHELLHANATKARRRAAAFEDPAKLSADDKDQEKAEMELVAKGAEKQSGRAVDNLKDSDNLDFGRKAAEKRRADGLGGGDAGSLDSGESVFTSGGSKANDPIYKIKKGACATEQGGKETDEGQTTVDGCDDQLDCREKCKLNDACGGWQWSIAQKECHHYLGVTIGGVDPQYAQDGYICGIPNSGTRDGSGKSEGNKEGKEESFKIETGACTNEKGGKETDEGQVMQPKIDDMKGCEDACRKNEDCGGWEWTENENECAHFISVVIVDVDKDFTTYKCGIPTETDYDVKKGECTDEPHGSALKEGFTDAKIEDRVECRNKCFEKSSECKGWSFNEEDRLCRHFEVPVHDADKSVEGVVCGIPLAQDESGWCFGRQSSWTLSSREAGWPWEPTPLAALRTGDYVLSAAAPDGSVVVDRVWKNLHLHDDVPQKMYEIRYEGGALVVTGNHMVYVDGILRAARDVRPGALLHTASADASDGGRADVARVVLTVAVVSEQLVNPITLSGRLLVGASSPRQPPPRTPASTAELRALLRDMVLVTTVIESLGDALLVAAELPRLGKIGVYLVPDALHESTVVEDAILLLVHLLAPLPGPLSVAALIVADTVGSVLFLAFCAASSVWNAAAWAFGPTLVGAVLAASVAVAVAASGSRARSKVCSAVGRDVELVTSPPVEDAARSHVCSAGGSATLPR
eukprot:TRINITY_DN11714_c0_g1_i1.p1 TRINITY_DN11714_c0_g1~~TRINITY_DN11714_c0_g1_i1.p1  ORF type:complete len:721 (+),score=138.30 TRINITY_DN11714_c0_g1_i1:81-2243(+)